MNIEIRRLKATDMDELKMFFRHVYVDTFEKNGAGHLTEDIEDELWTTARYLQQDIDTNGQERYFLLALYEGKIVGTIGMYEANSVITKLSKGELQNSTEVGTIYILPTYQNKGLGSLLLKAMMLTLQARGIQQFCLDSGFATAQTVWTKKFGNPTYYFENYWGENSHHMIWVVDTEKLQIAIPLS